jgi:hypothetical protein
MKTQTVQRKVQAEKIAQIDKVATALANQHAACACFM